MELDEHHHGHHVDDGAGGEAGEEGELARLVADIRGAERLMARAVIRAGELAGSGLAERVAGQPLDLHLGVACRLTGADRATLIGAGQVLCDMPVLRGLFAEGEVSWGQVRAVTRLVRKRSRGDRGWLDQRLAATCSDHEGDLSRVEPDELIGACEQAVDELRERAEAERAERAGVEASFVAVQPDLAGGARLFGELDALTATTVVGALDRAAPSPPRDEHGEAPTTAASGWSTTSRSRQYAEALGRICSEWAGGHPAADAAGGDGATADGGTPATGRRPKPLIRVGVQLAELTGQTAGVVDVPVRGEAPRLTAAAVEALACSAAVQAVVFDGARPLTTSDMLTAENLPDKVRQAVELRDGGCRWPGCDMPIAYSEIHHLVARALGGTHHPENVACLCRLHHLLAHARGWQLELDGDTGAVTGYRNGRHKWTTQPRGTPLATPTRAAADTGGGDRDPPDRDPPSRGFDPDRDPPEHAPPGWGALTDQDGDPFPF